MTCSRLNTFSIGSKNFKLGVTLDDIKNDLEAANMECKPHAETKELTNCSVKGMRLRSGTKWSQLGGLEVDSVDVRAFTDSGLISLVQFWFPFNKDYSWSVVGKLYMDKYPDLCSIKFEGTLFYSCETQKTRIQCRARSGLNSCNWADLAGEKKREAILEPIREKRKSELMNDL